MTGTGMGVTSDRIRNSIDEYNAFRASEVRFAQESQPNEFEYLILYLSPLILAVAIALRLTKVTANLA
jgi:hypothetical protein